METNMEKFETIYNNLPALKPGYEYYTLGQLVLDMTDRSDDYVNICGVSNIIKYIRPSHLFRDYRNCEINYDGIKMAPVNGGAEIYQVKAKGEFASFVDGIMKVGKLYLKDMGIYVEGFNDSCRSFFVEKSVFHFVLRQNGVAIGDYILKELMAKYVVEQAKQICEITHCNYLRPCDFIYLKIAIPSIVAQDEALESERFLSETFDSVLDVIDTYFDIDAREDSKNDLLSILDAVSSTRNTNINSHLYYTPLRRILEWMFRSARKLGLLHEKCFDDKDYINLTESSRFMAGQPLALKRNSGIICSVSHFPVIIANNVRLILETTGGASHTTEVSEKDRANLTAYWAKINTPYLLYSLTFMLCDILIWYGKYAQENPDAERNKKLWIDNNKSSNR